MHTDQWTERFVGLSNLPQPIRDRLHREGQLRRYPAGETLFGPGRVPDSLLFLLDGTIRVFQRSESGREIVLYRAEAGQSCVLTTACVLAEEAYAAEGVAETDVVAISLPRATFDLLTAEAPAFRDLIFKAYAHRMTELLRVIDDVAFGRIDIRLAGRLLTLAGTADELQITHAQLASELGTAREVVSRQLHEFQRRGWIGQRRGVVVLNDRAALSRLAADAA